MKEEEVEGGGQSHRHDDSSERLSAPMARHRKQSGTPDLAACRRKQAMYEEVRSVGQAGVATPFTGSHRERSALLCRPEKRGTRSCHESKRKEWCKVLAEEVVVNMSSMEEGRMGGKACYRIRSGGKADEDHYVQRNAPERV